MAILEVDPDLAVAWNYSVWHRQADGSITTRPDQRYNLKRSLKVYAEMQAVGIVTIPHTYWGIPDDLHNWAKWFADNPSVTTASVDLQTLDHRPEWDRALERLADLHNSLLPRRIHMLFSGRCVAKRVTELKQVWPESSLTNSGAQFGSGPDRFKRCYGLDRPWLTNPDAWTREDRFNEICRQYTKLFDGSSTTPPRSHVVR
jgi:hypothetical protein